MPITLEILFKSQPCNGYPEINIFLNNKIIKSHKFTQEYEPLQVEIIDDKIDHEFIIERYNKTLNNTIVINNKIVGDQILEIINIKINGVNIPEFFLQKHTTFSFNDEVHQGSKFFSPNGVWSFKFKNNLITQILDEKIIHEAKFNDDYKYSWAYKLGPDSVNTIIDQIDKITKLLENKL